MSNINETYKEHALEMANYIIPILNIKGTHFTHEKHTLKKNGEIRFLRNDKKKNIVFLINQPIEPIKLEYLFELAKTSKNNYENIVTVFYKDGINYFKKTKKNPFPEHYDSKEFHRMIELNPTEQTAIKHSRILQNENTPDIIYFQPASQRLKEILVGYTFDGLTDYSFLEKTIANNQSVNLVWNPEKKVELEKNFHLANNTFKHSRVGENIPLFE